MAEASPESPTALPTAGDAEQAWDRGLFFLYSASPSVYRRSAVRIQGAVGRSAWASRWARSRGGQHVGKGNSIVYCGVDVILRERVRGLALLREVLPG